MDWDCIIIGGGAAGFFAAITLKHLEPKRRVLVLEKTNVLLTKVRISGGGRCNVTHRCFEPKELVRHYPRGSKELLGAFHRFQPQDTVDWFSERGVRLVVEGDGRMFPSTHSSETIAKTLLDEAQRFGVAIRTQAKVRKLERVDGGFLLSLDDGEALRCWSLVLATGSSRDGHQWAQQLGHRIEAPVPSLFTFNCPTSPLKALSGVSVPRARVSLPGTPFEAEGPLLLTHFGFSGPAILRTSAFAARWLAEQGYKAALQISWLPDRKEDQILAELQQCKLSHPKRMVATHSPYELPQSLWAALVPELRWQDLSQKQMRVLAERLLRDRYLIDGKTTHKEEFVTAGGVCLKQIAFQTMESTQCPGLFFAGEILNVDGVTGGFNFQNAWTTGYLAAHGCAARLNSKA
jgi:predicted Rossmann fold flavoprotein